MNKSPYFVFAAFVLAACGSTADGSETASGSGTASESSALVECVYFPMESLPAETITIPAQSSPGAGGAESFDQTFEFPAAARTGGSITISLQNVSGVSAETYWTVRDVYTQNASTGVKGPITYAIYQPSVTIDVPIGTDNLFVEVSGLEPAGASAILTLAGCGGRTSTLPLTVSYPH